MQKGRRAHERGEGRIGRRERWWPRPLACGFFRRMPEPRALPRAAAHGGRRLEFSVETRRRRRARERFGLGHEKGGSVVQGGLVGLAAPAAAFVGRGRGRLSDGRRPHRRRRRRRRRFAPEREDDIGRDATRCYRNTIFASLRCRSSSVAELGDEAQGRRPDPRQRPAAAGRHAPGSPLYGGDLAESSSDRAPQHVPGHLGEGRERAGLAHRERLRKFVTKGSGGSRQLPVGGGRERAARPPAQGRARRARGRRRLRASDRFADFHVR